MARKRRGGIAEFFDGFNQGYQTVNRVMQDRALRDIAQAAPEESTGYTADQGDELRRAAESGQYDIGIKTKDDGTFDSYTVTPKADPSKSATVAMQGVTDFLGERRAGSMTDGQVDRARTMAQAGVLSKFGNPLEGQKLRQQAAQSEQMERQGVLTDLQIGRAKREEGAATKLEEANQEIANYMRGRQKMDEQGNPLPFTDDDFVMAGKQRVFALADRGLFDEAQKAGREAMDYATKKIQAETTQREAAVRDAVAGIAKGDFRGAMEVFNKHVPDGNNLTNVIPNKDGSFTLERVSAVDGTKLPPVRVDNLDKLVASVQSLADPKALTQYIDRTFKNDMETRRLKLAENADGRAGATFAQGQADRKEAKAEKAARADAAVNLFKDRNPNATPAEIAAVRAGILEAAPSTDKNAPSEVKLAQAMVASGLARDLRTGLEMAITKKSQSAKEAYLDLMKPQGGIAPREEDVAVVMETAFGADWRNKVGGPRGGQAGAGAPPKVNSQADLQKLPSGTRYQAPDGTIRIKQ